MKSKNEHRDTIERFINTWCVDNGTKPLAGAFFRKMFGFYPESLSVPQIETADMILLKIESALKSDKMTKEEFYKFYLRGLND